MVSAEAEGMALSSMDVRSVSEREGFMRGVLEVRQAYTKAHPAQRASPIAVDTPRAVSVRSSMRLGTWRRLSVNIVSPDNPMDETKALIESLNKELWEKGLKAYVSGQQVSFPISSALGASVARWPVVKEGEVLTVYRGQPKVVHRGLRKVVIPAELPLRTPTNPRPFFSTTDYLYIANRDIFGGKGGNVFKVTVMPGVRYLPILESAEGEVLIDAGGVAVYGTTKIHDSDAVGKRQVIPVTYSPQPTPTGARRTRRRRRLSRKRVPKS